MASRACYCWLAGRADAPRELWIGLLLASYAAGGFYTVQEAWEGIRKRRFDIDSLMIVAAAALGAWEEGSLLLFLFSLGHALEHMAMERARKAIEALAEHLAAIHPLIALTLQSLPSSECRNVKGTSHG